MVKPFQILLVPVLLGDLTKDKNFELVNSMPSFLQYALVGGAVVDELQITKLRKAKCPLTVGYGMTETASIISVVRPNEYREHACGKAVSTLTVRISPAGEILVKGENVMLGYYKDPEATARKIDADGWLHTGDKGHLDEDGYLYVEGRLEQDIIVLPNGENIRPDNIESLINALPEVSESIVLARDGKLVTIVVPNPSYMVDNIEEFSRRILYAVNPQLPLYSQLYGLEISKTPLARTEKQTIKRYLYK
jgi:long-chain acyl-CoA synthetase